MYYYGYYIYVYYCILYMCTIAYNMSVFIDERPSELIKIRSEINNSYISYTYYNYNNNNFLIF